VQATTFGGKEEEDATKHLHNFLEIGSTIIIKDVTQDIILLHLFPFSLEGRAKQWFYTNKEDINTLDKCSKAFLSKFFHTRLGICVNKGHKRMKVSSTSSSKWVLITRHQHHVTPIFKDKNRMHKRLMCAPGNSRTHKLTNYKVSSQCLLHNE
jgi:hypothetical protein